MQEATPDIEYGDVTPEGFGWEAYVADAVVGESAALEHGREAMHCHMRKLKVARQGRLGVRVWAPVEPTRAYDAARLRFGAAADLKAARTDVETRVKAALVAAGCAAFTVWLVGLGNP